MARACVKHAPAQIASTGCRAVGISASAFDLPGYGEDPTPRAHLTFADPFTAAFAERAGVKREWVEVDHCVMLSAPQILVVAPS